MVGGAGKDTGLGSTARQIQAYGLTGTQGGRICHQFAIGIANN